MEKLSKLKATFNRDNLKDLYKNLKKGVQIGVLGTALTAGTMFNTNCTQPSGGDTVDEPQTIEQPTNGGQTNGNGDQQTDNNGGDNGKTAENNDNTNENGNNSGNNGNNGQTGNDNNKDNENNNNNEQSNETDNNNNNENENNNNQQNENNDPVYGGEPYDKAIGNGNYILHNFVGENTEFSQETYVEATNHYLGKAETYVKSLANDLNKSLENRPTAQSYFANLINEVQNDNSFYINPYATGSQFFDKAVNIISDNAEPYFKDIIKNLDTENDRYAFYTAYRILANESFKEGLGTYREAGSPQMEAYEEQKNFAIELADANKEDEGPFLNVDIEQDYKNNFKETTNIMDAMVNQVVNNMNNKGIDLQASDLRQLINLTMTTNSLKGMHDLTKGALQHTACEMSLGINAAMDTAIREVKYAQQNQSQSMGL